MPPTTPEHVERLSGDDRRKTEAQAFFLDFYGPERYQERAAEIEALPVVIWKSQRLRTLRCHGITGRGPHDYNVPEAVLWSLVDLSVFRCPYH